MQGDGRQVHPQQSQVLHNERIHTDAIEVMNQPFHLSEFVIIDEGVDCGINTGPELMGIVACPAHVIECVGRIGTGSMM